MIPQPSVFELNDKVNGRAGLLHGLSSIKTNVAFKGVREAAPPFKWNALLLLFRRLWLQSCDVVVAFGEPSQHLVIVKKNRIRNHGILAHHSPVLDVVASFVLLPKRGEVVFR